MPCLYSLKWYLYCYKALISIFRILLRYILFEILISITHNNFVFYDDINCLKSQVKQLDGMRQAGWEYKHCCDSLCMRIWMHALTHRGRMLAKAWRRVYTCMHARARALIWILTRWERTIPPARVLCVYYQPSRGGASNVSLQVVWE